jgi:hypothetical protein
MSNTALQTKHDETGAIMERVLIVSNLAELKPQERVTYYNAVCESVGLNPLTRPFEYITLNGKLTLYARKDATDQLRKIHCVSIVELSEQEREGVYIVTAKAQDSTGRFDMAKGAVSLGSLKGEALANAIMKAETKAKRRVTLSICGLGILDETEVQTIPDARPVIMNEQGEIIEQPQASNLRFLPVTPDSIREFAKSKGIDIDAKLASQKKPTLEFMQQASLDKVYSWLQQAPVVEVTEPDEPQENSLKLSATQQRIEFFWRELAENDALITSEYRRNHFNQYLNTNQIEFNGEVSSVADIPDAIGDGYAKLLANMVDAKEARKNDAVF